MGLCESKYENKTDNKNIINTNKPKNKNGIKLDYDPNPLNVNHTHFVALNTMITHISKSICKLELSNSFCTGFFINFILKNKDFNCLVTCENSINKNRIDKKEEVNIIYDSENKNKEIFLDTNERYIKRFFDDYHLDITVIEILPKDNISKEYFLLPNIDFNYNNLNELINKEVLIMQYRTDKFGFSLGGVICEMDRYNFSLLSCSLEKGSTGSPIFLKDSTKVIGVFDSISYIKRCPNGILIFPIYEYFKNLSTNEIKSGAQHNSNEEINNNGNKEEPIAVHFISNDQNINYSLPSYPMELFSVVVDKLYKKFPDYKNKSCFFISDGKHMKLNYSMEQNKYKSGNKIIVCSN